MHDDAKAKSETDVAGAASGARTDTDRGHHVDADHQFDSRDARVSNFDQDTGTDERYEVESADRSSMTWLNAKRTFDLHQTLDASAITDKAKHQAKLDSMEIQAAEQRLLHQAKVNSAEIAERQQDHAQRLRFADANASVQIALLGDMAEKLGRIEKAVCDK